METTVTDHRLPHCCHRPLSLSLLASALPALMVTGCASLAPAAAPVAAAAPAAQWQAPLPAAPHAASSATSADAASSLQPADRAAELKRWWLQFNSRR